MKYEFDVRSVLCCLVAACCVATTAGVTSVRADDSARIIAKVNGVEIREGDLAFAEEDIGADVKQLDPQRKREEYIKYLQDVKLLSGFAAKEKLADSAEVKQELDRQIAFARSKAIMSAKLAEVGKSALNDVFLRSVYDEMRKSANNELEVRVRDIEFKFANRDNGEEVKAAQARQSRRRSVRKRAKILRH
jgi:peptidyl-prolyl cis-trans isomerase C